MELVQIVAATERVVPYGLQASRQIDFLKTTTIRECRISNICHAFWDYDTFQSTATGECTIANASHAAWNSYIGCTVQLHAQQHAILHRISICIPMRINSNTAVDNRFLRYLFSAVRLCEPPSKLKARLVGPWKSHKRTTDKKFLLSIVNIASSCIKGYCRHVGERWRVAFIIRNAKTICTARKHRPPLLQAGFHGNRQIRAPQRAAISKCIIPNVPDIFRHYYRLN